MQISRVKISNILGIEALEFEAGAFTQITGENGQGKTSVIEAIKGALSGGHDATLLRAGAERGEIVLVLDDETIIRKRLTETGQKTTVEKHGVRAPNPASEIKMLADLLSVNPLDFLRAPAKKRVEVLLDSLPMTASAERLSEILGRAIVVKPGDHALETIGLLYKQIYDDRTGTNRAIREKEATINQLAATLPDAATPGAAPEGDATGLIEKLAAIDRERDTLLERISRKLDGMRAEHEHVVDTFRSESGVTIAAFQQQIEALRQQIATETEFLTDRIAKQRSDFADVERRAASARENAQTAHAEARSGVATHLAAIQAVQSQAAKHQQTRATIKTMRVEAESLARDAEAQSAAIASLEKYKSELLEDLPIPGLEVRDNQIFRGGVVFDRLNAAQQVEIAIEIAKKRASKLGVICVDGLESLDSAHFEALKRQAISSGLQLFVTRVDDRDFAISS